MFGLSKRDFFIVVILNIVWGSAFAIAGHAMKYFPPLIAYSLRFFLIAVVTIPLFQVKHRRNRKKLFIMGICQAISFYGLCMGVNYLGSSVTAILSRFDTISTIIIGSLLFKEKMRPQIIFGLLVCLVAMLILNDGVAIHNKVWVVIIIFTSISGACVNIIAKSIKNEGEFTIVSWCCYYSGFILLFLAYIQEPSFALKQPLDWTAIIALLYMSIIGSFGCYATMFYLLRNNPSNRIMPYSFLRPIVAQFTGLMIMDEAIDIRAIVGISLLIVGIGFTQYRKSEELTEEQQEKNRKTVIRKIKKIFFK
ncbi:MAG: DMT family transporter [Rickettsiales bacterium]|nr:MAG: DMT family transporter [Rickettsiales bacterium]